MAYASKVIEVATAEIGYLEKASANFLDNKTANAGSKNYTKYARDLDAISGFYNGKKQGAAWCDVFVDWCFVQAYGTDTAKELLCQPSKSLGAGVGYSRKYYKAKGQLVYSPAVGDQIFFKDSKGNLVHTGLVVGVDKTYVYTIEGNTSSASGVVANGGCVRAKKYKLSYKYIADYGRPKYSNASCTAFTVKQWQNAAIMDGFSFPKYGTDGEWGAECEAVAQKAICKKRIAGYKYKNLTRLVQKAVGVTVDGLFGSNTKAAVKKYQAAHGLTADGEVGKNTWEAMLNV